MPAAILLSPGDRFGRLTVIERGVGKFPGLHWRCRCDCGREVVVAGRSMRTGNTTSCGCYCAERVSEANLTHGEARRGRWTVEFQAWVKMIGRCTNATDKWYPSYGGRGITVCDRWRESYESFLADMGRRPSPDHSLDRIDNDGPYAPDNCRWATRSQQQRNKRRQTNSHASSL